MPQGESSNPSTETLWSAWQTLPRWFEKYWELERWMDLYSDRSGEWTNGVIYPFLVTGIFIEIGCKGRFEVTVDDNKRADCFLIDSNSNPIAHIEHENEGLAKLANDLTKVSKTKPLLKCGITYGRQKEIDDMIPNHLKPVIEQSVKSHLGQSWLIIVGVYKPIGNTIMQGPTDWIAYKFDNDGMRLLRWGKP